MAEHLYYFRLLLIHTADATEPLNYKMNDLNKKAIGNLLSMVILVALPIFIPAWTLNYPQAWILLTVFSLSVLAITVYLMRNDTKLLERRVKAGPGTEKEKNQKIIQPLMFITFGATLILPAIDHRCGWSSVPVYVVAAGDMLVALGLLLIFFVFKENTFASAIVEIDVDQKIINTGPYAIVRHPMYTGGLMILVGAPLALGSWWGLLAFIPSTLVIVWRLLDEEKLLEKNLAGYTGYQNQVKYRLLPFIW